MSENSENTSLEIISQDVPSMTRASVNIEKDVTSSITKTSVKNSIVIENVSRDILKHVDEAKIANSIKKTSVPMTVSKIMPNVKEKRRS